MAVELLYKYNMRRFREEELPARFANLHLSRQMGDAAAWKEVAEKYTCREGSHRCSRVIMDLKSGYCQITWCCNKAESRFRSAGKARLDYLSMSGP